MGKGSQLTQLKSALSQAGLSRQSQPNHSNKKRKRSASAVRDPASDKDKKAQKLEEINRKLNPFDVKVTKVKHEVGGRHIKGAVGRPAQSKQAGLEQRKKLLLPQLEQKGRAGGVVDRRFGENDSTLTPEERMLERFTRERQKNSRGVNFNLEDDEELTHYGQSLSAIDDFDGTELALDEDPLEGQIDRETVQATHFGGFEDDEEQEGQPPRKKTKAEVMAEVMAKSKEYKYQRQMAKEQDEQVRHDIDKDFSSIRDLLFGPKFDPSSSGSNAIPLGKRVTVPADGIATPDAPADGPSADGPTKTAASAPAADEEEDYDQVVRQLAFDKRAKPTDRMKTEEELAAEEARKLEKAERARLRRMRGEDDAESDDEGRRRKRRRAEADDLEDDFALNEDDTLGLGKGLEAERPAKAGLLESDSEAESEPNEDSGSELSEEDDDEGSEASGLGPEAEDASVEGDIEDLVPATSRKRDKGKNKEVAQELPFTFPCPATHDEFLEIVDGLEPSDVSTVVQRIRTIFHPSLAEDNKLKLQTLCSVLIDHVLYAAASPIPSSPLEAALAPHIFSLSHSYPIPSAQAFRDKLVLMQKNLVRGLTRGPLLPESKTFPGTSELALFRLIGTVWSTSDLSHPVVSPAMLLIGQYLSQARIRSVSDIASGLFLCWIILKYQSLSARLVPEAVVFLINSLTILAPHSITYESLPGAFPALDFNQHVKLRVNPKTSTKLTPGAPNLASAIHDKADAPSSEQHKVDLLAMTYGLLEKFAKLYNSLEGFVELFEPVVGICEKIKTAKMSAGLKKSHSECLDHISRMIKFAKQSRKPLELQAHKPIPIASYIPKFDAGYSYRKRHDPDSERNEASKLKSLYRKEHKGAMRELRKDNKFLAEEQARRQAEKDANYKSRMSRVHGEIQVERAEEKAMQREKSKEKRRAGKK